MTQLLSISIFEGAIQPLNQSGSTEVVTGSRQARKYMPPASSMDPLIGINSCQDATCLN